MGEQAAISSAITFALGAALPLLLVWLSSQSLMIPVVAAGSLFGLGLLGGIAAKAGGANVAVGVARVTLLGALAMAVTILIGSLFGTVVG